jgi:hypothetical protein
VCTTLLSAGSTCCLLVAHCRSAAPLWSCINPLGIAAVLTLTPGVGREEARRHVPVGLTPPTTTCWLDSPCVGATRLTLQVMMVGGW